MISSDDIRHRFVSFFEEKDHLRISGSAVVPVNDPTLLYINSGMAPLKQYFTGEAAPPHPRLVNVQPCLRTKDIDDVGDRHHLTFFEMLGSWSIGDYFKQRAIELAFELLVERLGIPKERLFVTVYEGSEAMGLPPDTESMRAWEGCGLERDHIVQLGVDNFWGPAGDSGPCGPCTEVFYDTGPDFGPAYEPGGPFDTTRRYIEIWNAGVFMEFNKLPDGSLDRLRFASVDTGSGLERLAMTLNGKSSVYETDLLEPILKVVRQLLQGSAARERDALMICDHVRACTLILAEEVQPSNEGRGYIPRRLIRRCVAAAVRAGASSFDFNDVAATVIERLSPYYPHLRKQESKILAGFERERQGFNRVVEDGLARLDALCSGSSFTVSGEDAFKLFATHGLPLDLVRELVAERGGAVDEAALEARVAQHRTISRGSAETRGVGNLPSRVFEELGRELESSRFVGYDHLTETATVLSLVSENALLQSATAGMDVQLVTDQTPFYPEGGGQVGDRGQITNESATLRVDDTQIQHGVIWHAVNVEQGSLSVGDAVTLRVDQAHRTAVVANHSATHLLHAALREVLGTNVRQAGSKVEVSRLRFDFQHPSRVTEEQLETIEQRVNRAIRQNHRCSTSITSHSDAISQGALAFFGDNYGDDVRLVGMGDASLELCGGTHVDATGEVGMFRILSEGSVAKGIRRIVAITGESALDHTQQEHRVLRKLSATLKVQAPQLPAAVDELLARGKAESTAKTADAPSFEAVVQHTPGGISYSVTRVDALAPMRDDARQFADSISGLACLWSENDGRVQFSVVVGASVRERHDAQAVVRQLAERAGGKGGGRRHFAQGGAAQSDRTQAALAALGEIIDGTKVASG